jgi:hypothetical protein
MKFIYPHTRPRTEVTADLYAEPTRTGVYRVTTASFRGRDVQPFVEQAPNDIIEDNFVLDSTSGIIDYFVTGKGLALLAEHFIVAVRDMPARVMDVWKKEWEKARKQPKVFQPKILADEWYGEDDYDVYPE